MAKPVKRLSQSIKDGTGTIPDTNIPKFGYKSSFIILLSTFFTLFIVPYIGLDYRMPTVVLGGLVAGFSTVYTQFFIEKRRGLIKYFWIVGGLLSIFCGLLIFILVYAGIIM